MTVTEIHQYRFDCTSDACKARSPIVAGETPEEAAHQLEPLGWHIPLKVTPLTAVTGEFMRDLGHIQCPACMGGGPTDRESADWGPNVPAPPPGDPADEWHQKHGYTRAVS